MSPSPNVLMLGWELPPHNTGGLGVACQGLTRSLAARGTHIAFALPKKLPNNLPYMDILEEPIDGVEVTAINSLLSPYGNASQYGLNANSSAANQIWGNDLYAEAYRFAEAVSSWSDRKTFNLVHAHDWMTFPAGMTVSKKRSKPFIAHVHATEYDRTGGHVDSRIADIEYYGLNQADRVITVSQYTSDIIHDHYHINQDKITVVHNGLDPIPFDSTDFRRFFGNDKVVLFVGRLTFQKGVEYFLQAAKRVLTYLPNTVFLVVGNGDLYQKHLLEAAYLGISDRVIFTGFLKGKQLQTIYHLADVFVMPSVSEPYGLVALEAIAAGTPAVISKNSGVKESVEHVHLVDFWDINKMSSLIIQSLVYPHQAKLMGVMAKTETQKMTWDMAAQKTLNVYDSVLT